MTFQAFSRKTKKACKRISVLIAFSSFCVTQHSNKTSGEVAQLVSAPDCRSGGCGFDPRPSRQFQGSPQGGPCFFCRRRTAIETDAWQRQGISRWMAQLIGLPTPLRDSCFKPAFSREAINGWTHKRTDRENSRSQRGGASGSRALCGVLVDFAPCRFFPSSISANPSGRSPF